MTRLDRAWRRAALTWTLLAFCAMLPLSIAGINGTAALLPLLLLVSTLSGDSMPWKHAVTPFSAALLAYCAVAALVSAAGVDPAVSVTQLAKDFHKLWLLWLLLVSLPLADTRRLPVALGGACLVSAIYGIGQALLLRVPLNAAGGTAWLRAHGFVHPVVYGELMGLFCIGAVCFWLRPRPESPHPRLVAACIAMTTTALILSQTRGAVIGAAVGLAALGLLDRRLRLFSLLMILAAPAAFVLWELMPSNHNITTILESLDRPGLNPHFARLTFWRVGWRMFLDHPWLGVGPGNYRTLYAHYFQGAFDGERVWGSAHNLYIHQAAERGLLGLAALAAVLGTMTARAWQRARQAPAALNLWAFSSCVAFLVMNLTEAAFQTEQVASLMIFIWALAEAQNGVKPTI